MPHWATIDPHCGFHSHVLPFPDTKVSQESLRITTTVSLRIAHATQDSSRNTTQLKTTRWSELTSPNVSTSGTGTWTRRQPSTHYSWSTQPASMTFFSSLLGSFVVCLSFACLFVCLLLVFLSWIRSHLRYFSGGFWLCISQKRSPGAVEDYCSSDPSSFYHKLQAMDMGSSVKFIIGWTLTNIWPCVHSSPNWTNTGWESWRQTIIKDCPSKETHWGDLIPILKALSHNHSPLLRRRRCGGKTRIQQRAKTATGANKISPALKQICRGQVQCRASFL